MMPMARNDSPGPRPRARREGLVCPSPSLEDLRKALDKCPKIKAGFVPKKEDGSYDWESLSIKQELKLIRFDTWKKLVEAKFSVFLADYDKQRKQLFDKCAYVDFERKPAIVCNLCRFYHGLQKGCSWEEEKKELLEAQK